MNSPWDIKKKDVRKANTLVNFIIFCEDSVSEPIYLNYFQSPKIKINCIKNQKSKMSNVLNAIHHCEGTGLIRHENGEYWMSEDSQVWCVFDRDKEETKEKIAIGNVNFNESIETAKRRGIKVAWSNDSFELWVLLHFEDVNIKYINRIDYYDKLTEIFRNIQKPNDDLQKALAHAGYNYKRDFKSANNFRYIVRNEIVTKTNDAIARAKILEEHFSKTSVQNHEKSPCTLIYHLVEELLKFGEKPI